MIVSCPECATRIRLDRTRLAGKRVKLRCSRCGGVFHAEVPSDAVLLPAQTPESPADRKDSAVHATRSDDQIDVLVAHSDPNLCATIGDVLARHADLRWWSCHNGDEALASMEKRVPAVAIVDVALPGLFAFELVEKVRKRPGLASVRLILLSSVYNKMAYKRTPNSLYGADDYIEKHHIAIDLVDKIRLLTKGSRGSLPSQPAVLPSSATEASDQTLATSSDVEELQRIQEVNSRIINAEKTEVAAAAGTDEAMIKAQRLARIIVSDIALYNQDLVEEGVRNGTFFVLLAAEVQEGRRLFSERISALIPNSEGILEQAFSSFIERRRRELSLS